MKAISLWQPWAQWVALGWKTIETRTHDRFASLISQRIAIHAAQRWDTSAWGLARAGGRPVTGLDMMKTMAIRVRQSAVLCTVKVTVGVWASEEEYSHSLSVWGKMAMIPVWRKYCMHLSDVQRVRPLPFKGTQGIFEVSDELLQPWSGDSE